MQKEHITKGEIKLIGLSLRTNNQNEIDPMKGKIFPLIQKYFHETWAKNIPHRKNPNVTFCAYTDYENDHTGDYTYFIGEEVTDINGVPEGFDMLIIPAQTYDKFTTNPGQMPDVIRNAWFEIWEMYPKAGQRKYLTDFEVYDERAADHSKIILDIYIGVHA